MDEFRKILIEMNIEYNRKNMELPENDREGRTYYGGIINAIGDVIELIDNGVRIHRSVEQGIYLTEKVL